MLCAGNALLLPMQFSVVQARVATFCAATTCEDTIPLVTKASSPFWVAVRRAMLTATASVPRGSDTSAFTLSGIHD